MQVFNAGDQRDAPSLQLAGDADEPVGGQRQLGKHQVAAVLWLCDDGIKQSAHARVALGIWVRHAHDRGRPTRHLRLPASNGDSVAALWLAVGDLQDAVLVKTRRSLIQIEASNGAHDGLHDRVLRRVVGRSMENEQFRQVIWAGGKQQAVRQAFDTNPSRQMLHAVAHDLR